MSAIPPTKIEMLLAFLALLFAGQGSFSESCRTSSRTKRVVLNMPEHGAVLTIGDLNSVSSRYSPFEIVSGCEKRQQKQVHYMPVCPPRLAGQEEQQQTVALFRKGTNGALQFMTIDPDTHRLTIVEAGSAEDFLTSVRDGSRRYTSALFTARRIDESKPDRKTLFSYSLGVPLVIKSLRSKSKKLRAVQRKAVYATDDKKRLKKMCSRRFSYKQGNGSNPSNNGTVFDLLIKSRSWWLKNKASFLGCPHHAFSSATCLHVLCKSNTPAEQCRHSVAGKHVTPLQRAYALDTNPAQNPPPAPESHASATVQQNPVTETCETLREAPYDWHIRIVDKTVIRLQHPCEYLRCNNSGETCIVRVAPALRATLSTGNFTTQPHCASTTIAVERPQTTRECFYKPHLEIAGVETLTCNCRRTCNERGTAVRVCGSDGKTYTTYCHLQRRNCLTQNNILPLHSGPCEDSQAMTQRHNCQPDLTITSIDAESHGEPVQYYYGFMQLHCNAPPTTCPGVGTPVWYKQNYTDGVLSEQMEFVPDSNRTIGYSSAGRSYMAIFPTKQEDTGLYTCKVRVGDHVFSRSKNIIVKEPANESTRQARQSAYRAAQKAIPE